MFEVGKEDVIQGLKRFKRLAKQDLLASSLTSNPQFWSRQAEARRAMYTSLMNLVEEKGVELAYETARREYASLPRFAFDGAETNPQDKGRAQALEMFFTLLGVDSEKVMSMRPVSDSSAQGETAAVSSR